MRISDWSSDVCSSDLDREGRGRELVAVVAHEGGTLVFGVEVVAEFGVVVHDRGSGEVGNHNLSGGHRDSLSSGGRLLALSLYENLTTFPALSTRRLYRFHARRPPLM